MLAGSGDLLRHLYYGVLVNQSGWSAAGRPLDAFPSLAGVTWSWVPYNYPIVTLAFFSALAFRKFLVKRAVASSVLAGALVFAALSAFSPQFVKEAAKPEKKAE